MGNTSPTFNSGSSSSLPVGKLTKSEQVQQEMNNMITQHKVHIKMMTTQKKGHAETAATYIKQKNMVAARQEFVYYKQLTTQIQSVQNAVNAVQRQQNTLYQQALNDETMRIMRTAARVNAAQHPTLENAIELADQAAEIADLTADMTSALADSSNSAALAEEDEEWQTFCNMISVNDAAPPPPFTETSAIPPHTGSAGAAAAELATAPTTPLPAITLMNAGPAADPERTAVLSLQTASN